MSNNAREMLTELQEAIDQVLAPPKPEMYTVHPDDFPALRASFEKQGANVVHHYGSHWNVTVGQFEIVVFLIMVSDVTPKGKVMIMETNRDQLSGVG